MPSWSRRQQDAFARQGAAHRRAVNADPDKPAIFEGKPLCVSRTGIAHRREIEAGGFEQMPDAVVRVDRAAYPWFLPTEAAAKAAVGKLLTLEGVPLKIVEAKRLDAEIVLTLGKQ